MNFLRSEEAKEIKRQLELMVKDDAFKTSDSYSADSESYPDNLIPFADKHIKYLSENLGVNAKQYLANLRMLTRK